MYKIVKDYRNDKTFRDSFNHLAQKTFGLDFEDWYQNGFWREHYIPYSIVKDQEVVANVSVNITKMRWNGGEKFFLQLGTVMTEETYRNQGLIRKLMEEIEADYANKAEGIYLFANDGVLDVYPKFGYKKAEEYQYSKQVSIETAATMLQVPMENKQQWNQLEEAIHSNQCFNGFDIVENSGLYMFYVSKFMQENVYYDKTLDTYVIAEVEGEELLIHGFFSKNQVSLEDVIQSFGSNIKKVILGFAPKDVTGYTRTQVQEEDTTLFVKGAGFADFEKNYLMFPTLVHA